MNYIYTLSDPNTNQVRYIGKTNNLERRYKRHTCKFTLVNENTFKSKWILSLLDDEKLPILEVIDECVDKIIDNLESYWISQFKCWGFDLTNMTDGGDGFKGNSKYQIRSEYSKFLIKMNNRNRKDVIQLDLGNNIVDYHLSIHDASNKTGFHRSHISGCCKNKRGFTICHGYYFRYVDNYFICDKAKIMTDADILKINLQISKIKSDRYVNITKSKKNTIKTRKCKRVVEYDSNGIIINVYDSTKITSIETGISIPLISRCCRVKGHSSAKNRIFRYEYDKFDWTQYDVFSHKTNKLISQYTIDGKFIKNFKSIKEAARYISGDFGHISKCCKNKIKKNGKNRIVGGYTWRFFDEFLGKDII